MLVVNPLVWFGRYFLLPRMAGAVALEIVVILEVLSLEGLGGLPRFPLGWLILGRGYGILRGWSWALLGFQCPCYFDICGV